MSERPDILETKAAELGGRRLEFNELDFVGWKEFRRMAPAIISLEVSRLERVMACAGPGCEAYNTLVRARYEMRQFRDGLEGASREDVTALADHLRRALLAVCLLTDGSDTLQYAARRLQYVHDRLQLIY